MKTEKDDIRAIIAGIVASAPEQRARAALGLAGWVTPQTSLVSAAPLARVLEAVLSIEDDEHALEAELDALSEVSSLGLVPRDVVSRVLASRDWNYPWATGFIQSLEEDLSTAPS